MRFDVLTRMVSVIVLKDDEDMNYSASCSVFIQGDRGIMFGINGRDFYEALATRVPELLKKVGVKTLEGYVSRAHARLMRMVLRDKAKFETGQEGTVNGHKMVWVTISERDQGY